MFCQRNRKGDARLTPMVGDCAGDTAAVARLQLSRRAGRRAAFPRRYTLPTAGRLQPVALHGLPAGQHSDRGRDHSRPRTISRYASAGRDPDCQCNGDPDPLHHCIPLPVACGGLHQHHYACGYRHAPNGYSRNRDRHGCDHDGHRRDCYCYVPDPHSHTPAHSNKNGYQSPADSDLHARPYRYSLDGPNNRRAAYLAAGGN